MESICSDDGGARLRRIDPPSPEISTSEAAFSDEEVYIKLAADCPKKRAGRKKFCETRHPVYRGVRRRNGGKWVCEVREPNTKARIWLGTHPTAEMAARAHDVTAMAFRGRSACLHFADSGWLLPIPDTGDASDIQKAAVEAAQMFRPVPEPEWTVSRDEASPENFARSPEIGLPFDTEEQTACSFQMSFESITEELRLSPTLSLESRFHWDDSGDCHADTSLWSY